MRPVRTLPLVVLAVAVLSGCAGDSGAVPQSQAATSADGHEHHHDTGDTGETGGGEFTIGLGGPVSLSGTDADGAAYELTYSVTGVDTAKKDDTGDKPGDGNVFVVVDVAVTVYQGSHRPGIDNTDYLLCFLAADGTEYHPAPQVVGDALGGTVEAEETVTGTMLYDVPETDVADGQVRLTATANGGDQVIFWTQ